MIYYQSPEQYIANSHCFVITHKLDNVVKVIAQQLTPEDVLLLTGARQSMPTCSCIHDIILLDCL